MGTNRILLSENFSAHEFACSCGCSSVVLSPLLIRTCQRTRDRIGKPIVISSGFRCKNKQDSIYEEMNIKRRLAGLASVHQPNVSQHELGTAIDTSSIYYNAEQHGPVADFIAPLRGDGWVGIGIEPRLVDSKGRVNQWGFVHLDVRSMALAFWWYGYGR